VLERSPEAVPVAPLVERVPVVLVEKVPVVLVEKVPVVLVEKVPVVLVEKVPVVSARALGPFLARVPLHPGLAGLKVSSFVEPGL
jgi:hypothetical protein